mgnify:FL=1|jgi:uncharacterized membrane protein YhaH (DUF805 family)
MFSNKLLMATLLGRVMRRSGWGVVAMLIVFNALHWKRHGTLDWSDARASLLVLLAYLAVSLLLEYKRLRDEERASVRTKAAD